MARITREARPLLGHGGGIYSLGKGSNPGRQAAPGDASRSTSPASVEAQGAPPDTNHCGRWLGGVTRRPRKPLRNGHGFQCQWVPIDGVGGGALTQMATKQRKVVAAFPCLLPPGLATTRSHPEFCRPEARPGLSNLGKGLLSGEASGKA